MSNNIKIRASSLQGLFDCPARWAAIHIDGRRLPSSGAAQLGTAVHAGAGAYDASRLAGGNALTIDEAAGAVVDAIHKPSEDVDWDEDSPNDVERVALALHAKYCQEVAPKQKYIGVELKCEALVIDDLGITLTGTTDRIRMDADGRLGISDLKTGKTAVSADGVCNTKGHAVQMAVYELLASSASYLPITAPAQIIGLQTGKTDKAQRVAVGEIVAARELLLGDEHQEGVLAHASKLIKSGNFFGNPKSMLCHQKYCPNFTTCNFRK